jgi:hypothetical protein
MQPLDKALIVLGVLAAIFAAQRLHALSCASGYAETVQLGLESVEVDDQPIDDLTAYEPYEVELRYGGASQIYFRIWFDEPDVNGQLSHAYRSID